MRKQFRIPVVILLIVALVGGVAWMVFCPKEPVYKRKRLGAWLEIYGNATKGADTMAANEAVGEIGTNAIPTLLRLLRTKDTFLKLKMAELLQKQHLFKIKIVPAAVLHSEGISGMTALGAYAKGAVPELITIYKQAKTTEEKDAIAYLFCSIGPEAEEAIPSLVHELENIDSAPSAIFALGAIHSKPEIVVPILTKCLATNYPWRQNVAEALGKFGADAKPAIPGLVKLMNEPDGMSWKDYPIDALIKIDPVEAPKLVVPVLVKCLIDDGVSGPRLFAVQKLGLLGPDAKPAVPALLALLDSTDEVLPGFVLYALSRIDPEEGKKASIKFNERQ